MSGDQERRGAPPSTPLPLLSRKDDDDMIKSVAGGSLHRKAQAVAQLNWPEAMPLFETHLGDLPLKVFDYGACKPGARANETGICPRFFR